MKLTESWVSLSTILHITDTGMFQKWCLEKHQTSKSSISDSFDLFGYWLNNLFSTLHHTIFFYFLSSLLFSPPHDLHLSLLASQPQKKKKKTGTGKKKTHLFTSTRFHRISPPSSSCKLDSFNFVVNVFQCPSLSLWNSHCSCCGAAAVAERLGVIKVDDKNLHYRGHLYSHMKVAEVKIEVNCRGRELGCVWYLVLFYF